MRAGTTCTLTAATLVVLIAGCTGQSQGDIEGDADAAPRSPADSHEETTLVAGHGFELDLPMTAGQALTWDWYTQPETVIGFDVHRHEGEEVLYPYKVQKANDRGSFTAEVDDVHSVYWLNDGEGAVTLRYQAGVS